jgi:hypothetical protein
MSYSGRLPSFHPLNYIVSWQLFAKKRARNLERIRDSNMKIQKFICFLRKRRSKFLSCKFPICDRLGSVHLPGSSDEEPEPPVRNAASDLVHHRPQSELPAGLRSPYRPFWPLRWGGPGQFCTKSDRLSGASLTAAETAFGAFEVPAGLHDPSEVLGLLVCNPIDDLVHRRPP